MRTFASRLPWRLQGWHLIRNLEVRCAGHARVEAALVPLELGMGWQLTEMVQSSVG